MTSKERVLKAIRHEEPDRVPLNVWLYRGDYAEIINEKYGSVDGFLDHYDIDIFTVFVPVPWNHLERRIYTLDEALDMDFPDPATDEWYDPVRHVVEHYGNNKQRAVFCQTGGVFETTNGFLGIENNLANMAIEPEKTSALYEKVSEWFQVQIQKIIDIGVDVVHMSDDWGENRRMMFRPQTWWDLIYPHDKAMIDICKKNKVPVSLHTCGYVMDVLDGCVKMGLDVLNPIQTSAGMDPYKVKSDYGDKLCLYGCLDVRDVLPTYSKEDLEKEVKSIMEGCKSGGGLIFCTAHTVNMDVPLSSLEHAYECAHKYGSY